MSGDHEARRERADALFRAAGRSMTLADMEKRNVRADLRSCAGARMLNHLPVRRRARMAWALDGAGVYRRRGWKSLAARQVEVAQELLMVAHEEREVLP